jgi:hypothetical protein
MLPDIFYLAFLNKLILLVVVAIFRLVLRQSNARRELANPPGGSGNFLHRIICPIANPWYYKIVICQFLNAI